jgi:hypothetical protein
LGTWRDCVTHVCGPSDRGTLNLRLACPPLRVQTVMAPRFQAELEREIVLEFEQGAAAERLLLQRRARTDRTWLMAERLATALRRQGFIPRVHFLERWLERARAFGVRLDPATFRRQFQQARHYRQTRPGYSNRIVVIAGTPVLYRMGGPRGRHVVLLGVLPRMPPVTRAQAPPLAPAREAESMLAFDDPQVRAVCEQARIYLVTEAARADQANRTRQQYWPDESVREWLASTARYWARGGPPGQPGRLGRLSPADIDRLLTCLVSLEQTIRVRIDRQNRRIRLRPLADVTRLRIRAVEELRRRGRWP